MQQRKCPRKRTRLGIYRHPRSLEWHNGTIEKMLHSTSLMIVEEHNATPLNQSAAKVLRGNHDPKHQKSKQQWFPLSRYFYGALANQLRPSEESRVAIRACRYHNGTKATHIKRGGHQGLRNNRGLPGASVSETLSFCCLKKEVSRSAASSTASASKLSAVALWIHLVPRVVRASEPEWHNQP